MQTFAAGRGEVNPAAGTPTAEDMPVPCGGASYLLTLEGYSGQTIYFSDRRDRMVGAVPTMRLLLEGPLFPPENPPNAVLVGEFESGQGVVGLELIGPRYDSDTGTVAYGAECWKTTRARTWSPCSPNRWRRGCRPRLPGPDQPSTPAGRPCGEGAHRHSYSMPRAVSLATSRPCNRSTIASAMSIPAETPADVTMCPLSITRRSLTS